MNFPEAQTVARWCRPCRRRN